MQDLIQKLEKATEGSRELDELIARQFAMHLTFAVGVDPSRASKTLTEIPEPFTRSIDAALSLRPEGMEWEATNLYGIASASVGINADDGPFYGTSEFGSVPLALCIAALRARHSQSGDDPRKNISERQEGV